MSKGINFEIRGGSLRADDLQQLLHMSYNFDRKNPASHGDFQVDRELSGDRVQVYYNRPLNQCVIVHRGTKGMQDWGSDLQMAFGYRSGYRFEHSKRIQDAAVKKYAGAKISTIGHSLGAALASDSGKKNSDEIVRVNGPTLNVWETQPKNQFDVRSARDPVSALKKYQWDQSRTHTIASPWLTDPLTEHSTSVLGREKSDKMFGQGFLGPGVFGIRR